MLETFLCNKYWLKILKSIIINLYTIVFLRPIMRFIKRNHVNKFNFINIIMLIKIS